MKTQNILIVHPASDEQVTVLKAFLEALKIRFEFSKEEAYNSDFVAKIEKSREQAKNGQVTRVKKNELKEFLAVHVR